ncbi:acetyl/propionyl/methylcrotonyl-CoA carboxylase subunit alpha [Thioclava pacifica]|uniref:3-methylcrotonyl-CoA carboxylase subunit alpha n=1 Tax=Thioclava pacifica DSM 10166 TaxID=1353537 RepID=A0A074J6L7_9RHOB|nr:acetyl/propionyl/methylcrotonyl-CoA carboxylase subunit alpha [Thioclava pacifica]KEO51540.1 3-methylcrotonyl-CoA carboxylase subunit alpha [Thioclava pacifica DSM 10166]
MFSKILIANRGEIACRVIETARKLGVASVAVYSEADAQARHVAMADEAVAIGGPAPKDSYLRAEAIIAAAQQTGAQAIHPGYGFLSENPDFVEAVEAAGLTFIGPSAKAIRAMGLKDAAKALMEKAGVPVVPGYHGENQDPEHLAGAADTIGYPVLIKAVAGGGGKGMRLVEKPSEFADALASAQGEAQTAFGNPAVLIEKFISAPRHIEVQVFGDGEKAVHLFERDCSLQRRHQKVIEEAPAPGMTPEMREAMGQAATRAAEAIGYKGAGTVEFIVDGSDGLRPDRFWFMEMNTRLQVEHPVTEAITGVDLVEWQLRVASGEPLPCAQEDLSITGHAFEARLYAEDVPAGFLPATGTLSHLRFAEGCRADTGVRTGDTISPWYDPMIAKVITHGPTRATALGQLARALEETEVAGTVTNLAFLARLARHEGFAAGKVDTGLIGREIDTLSAPVATPAAAKALGVIAAAGLWEGAASGFNLWGAPRRAVPFEEEAAIRVHGPGHVTVELGEVSHDCVLAEDGWRVDGAKTGARMARDADAVTIFLHGAHRFEIPDLLARGSDAEASDLTLAPMPGLVKSVFVKAGQQVAAGDRLAIMEAMKMEHTMLAARDGVVAEVLVTAGAQVEAGAALIRLEEEE